LQFFDEVSDIVFATVPEEHHRANTNARRIRNFESSRQRLEAASPLSSGDEIDG
jgi:hypothetical protein